MFPTQLFCSVCKIRLASPPYSPVLLLGLLISSLRVPFFLCGLAKVGGREACPCTCSNTTRFYSWFIPIYTTFFPRFQDTRRISTLLSIFFLIVCWDKKSITRSNPPSLVSVTKCYDHPLESMGYISAIDKRRYDGERHVLSIFFGRRHVLYHPAIAGNQL